MSGWLGSSTFRPSAAAAAHDPDDMITQGRLSAVRVFHNNDMNTVTDDNT